MLHALKAKAERRKQKTKDGDKVKLEDEFRKLYFECEQPNSTNQHY
jgi:hypothetical protein